MEEDEGITGGEVMKKEEIDNTDLNDLMNQLKGM